MRRRRKNWGYWQFLRAKRLSEDRYTTFSKFKIRVPHVNMKLFFSVEKKKFSPKSFSAVIWSYLINFFFQNVYNIWSFHFLDFYDQHFFSLPKTHFEELSHVWFDQNSLWMVRDHKSELVHFCQFRICFLVQRNHKNTLRGLFWSKSSRFSFIWRRNNAKWRQNNAKWRQK